MTLHDSHAAEEAFWSAIDDGPTDEQQDDEWFWDYFGHAEKEWQQ